MFFNTDSREAQTAAPLVQCLSPTGHEGQLWARRTRREKQRDAGRLSSKGERRGEEKKGKEKKRKEKRRKEKKTNPQPRALAGREGERAPVKAPPVSQNNGGGQKRALFDLPLGLEAPRAWQKAYGPRFCRFRIHGERYLEARICSEQTDGRERARASTRGMPRVPPLSRPPTQAGCFLLEGP